MTDSHGREWRITASVAGVAIKSAEPIGKRFQMFAVRAPIGEAMPILREWADEQ